MIVWFFNFVLFFLIILISSIESLLTSFLKKSNQNVHFQNLFFETPQLLIKNISLVGFGVSGICIGMGTKLVKGSIFEHGVSGLSRFSPNSLIVLIFFFSFGFLISNTGEYYLGWMQYTEIFYVNNIKNYDHLSLGFACFGLVGFVLFSIFYLIFGTKFLRKYETKLGEI